MSILNPKAQLPRRDVLHMEMLGHLLLFRAAKPSQGDPRDSSKSEISSTIILMGTREELVQFRLCGMVRRMLQLRPRSVYSSTRDSMMACHGQQPLRLMFLSATSWQKQISVRLVHHDADRCCAVCDAIPCHCSQATPRTIGWSAVHCTCPRVHVNSTIDRSK